MLSTLYAMIKIVYSGALGLRNRRAAQTVKHGQFDYEQLLEGTEHFLSRLDPELDDGRDDIHQSLFNGTLSQFEVRVAVRRLGKHLQPEVRALNEAFRGLFHPNVSQLLGVSTNGPHACLVYSLVAEEGTLKR
jgi:Zn-dependent M32 family carboxypeptidase